MQPAALERRRAVRQSPHGDRIVRVFVRGHAAGWVFSRCAADGRAARHATGHDVLCFGSPARAEGVHRGAALVRFVTDQLGCLSRRHLRRKVSACDGCASGVGEGTRAVARFHAGRESWGRKRTPARRVHLVWLVDLDGEFTARRDTHRQVRARTRDSLRFIDAAGITTASCVIDVGGGDSRLVDRLVERGLRCVFVLDVSGAALARAKARLGTNQQHVTWVDADVTGEWVVPAVDIWHDRAVFHFLTDAAGSAALR